MKLVLDTDTRKVSKQPPSDTDKQKDPIVLEREITILLSLAVAAEAHNTYKTLKVQERYIDEVAKCAKRLLIKMENGEVYDEV